MWNWAKITSPTTTAYSHGLVIESAATRVFENHNMAQQGRKPEAINLIPKADRIASRFTCPSCGSETFGRFCGNCGEKEVTDQDYSLRHYLKEIVTAVTFLESKLCRSLWLVLSRPGYLSNEYFRGRRIRYIKPLQLFVFLNVAYYFSLSLFYATTFTTPLATQLQMNNYYPKYASMRVSKKLQKDQIGYDALEIKYNKKTSVLSKTLIFLFIPIFALLFNALFYTKRKYLVEHLVVATHFWSFILLMVGIILPLATDALIWFFKALSIPTWYATSDVIVSTFLQLCFAIYLFVMLRRCYGISKWYGVLTASAMAWSFFHIVWLYRYILFEATLGIV